MQTDPSSHEKRTFPIVAMAVIGSVALACRAAPEIVDAGVVCKEAGRYVGWPTVCRRSTGELLVVFSGDRDGHVCPWGRVELVRSADDGKTWSKPVTIANTILDDRDAGIVELPDGTLLVNWFTSTAWVDWSVKYADRHFEPNESVSPDTLFYGAMAGTYLRHYGKLSKTAAAEALGNWIIRSTDGGRTWGSPVRQAGTRPHGVLALRDGRLLAVGCRDRRPICEASADGGRSWKVVSAIPVPEEFDDRPGVSTTQVCEPHAVELRDGRILAMFRYQRHPVGGWKMSGECLTSESNDGGCTWTPVRSVGLSGYPPHLTELRDGRVLCSYSNREEGRFGEYVRISDDGGRTWPAANEMLIRRHFDNDLGYPTSVELPDGTIFTAYYQAETRGEKAGVLYTRWRPGRP